MPKTVTWGLTEGMRLKPPERQTEQSAIWTCKCLCGSRKPVYFQPCIQMDVDSCNHRKEWITLSCMYLHIMQAIIIEDPVIDSFTGSTVVVDGFVFFCASGNRSVEPHIPGWLSVNTPPIWRFWAGITAGAFFLFSAGYRAAPFAAAAPGTESPA